MKKLLLLICICLILPASAETLHGRTSYTVDSVREILQQEIQKEIPTYPFKNKLYDHSNYKNLSLLKSGVTETKNKILIVFYNPDRSLNSYGIVYKNDPYHSYIYDKSGKLELVEISDKSYGEYPNKFYAYNIVGKLIGYIFDVSKKESYSYNSNGSLNNYCVENTCYDENNKVLWTRDF